MCAYLGHCGQVLLSAGQCRLFSHLEVKVNQFVTESGEFIAEANSVCAGRGRRPRECVELLLNTLVEHFAARALQRHVYVIVTASDHLSVQDQK